MAFCLGSSWTSSVLLPEELDGVVDELALTDHNLWALSWVDFCFDFRFGGVIERASFLLLFDLVLVCRYSSYLV